MTNQEILNMLSELEEDLFYKSASSYDDRLKDMHDRINACLIAWAKYSGCKTE